MKLRLCSTLINYFTTKLVEVSRKLSRKPKVFAVFITFSTQYSPNEKKSYHDNN